MTSPELTVMTVPEIAKYLKIAEKTVRKNFRIGKFTGKKLNGSWRTTKEWIDSYMGFTK